MYEIVSGEVETRKIDLIQVMGREGAVTAYEVLGLKGELSPLTRRVLEVYARGLRSRYGGL